MVTSFVKQLALHWESVRTGAVDLIFPPRCVGCQRAGLWLCPPCAQKVEPVGERICLCCGQRQPAATPLCLLCEEQERSFCIARAATIHQGAIREGLHQLKYGGVAELAPVLAPYLVAAFLLDPWPLFSIQIDAVTPVPVHAERRKQRGYNQAELLARAFCRQVKLPLEPSWLERTRLTHSQVGLHRHERQANVADAFCATPAVRDRAILLIDDVCTTGATLHACAAAALAAGAKAVYALTLATPAQFGGEPIADLY